MVPPRRRLPSGRPDGVSERYVDVLLAVAAGVASIVGYATGVFTVSGGVVVVPATATLLGVLAAGGVGYRRSGLLLAWLAAFTPLFTFGAEWGVLGLSGHDLGERLAFVFDPVSLAVYGATAVVSGVTGYVSGSFLRGDVDVLGAGET
ncbi:hypothetical protein ACFPYI_00640 [Halomarina salina]|uniref:Uncharacterized protein n=1 Tax=Halomarina salina TaxID=1872699 RepID=A0ABD5RHJ3_9EURY|nr:hypothetical protein [Halomarina salina]